MSTNLLTLSSLPPTHLLPSPNHTPTISLIPPTHPSLPTFSYFILFWWIYVCNTGLAPKLPHN